MAWTTANAMKMLSTTENPNSTQEEDYLSPLECILRDRRGNPMVNMSIPVTTFTICVIGNLFAIVFLWKSNQRSDNKQHIFYTLVMTLACCDFLSCIATSPITFAAYMSGHCVMELGGEALCKYSGSVMTFFGIGSMAIVFAMSLERFIAIRYALFYQTSVTTYRTRIFLTCIISFLLLLSALPLLGLGEIAQQFPGSWCFLDWKSRVLRHQVFNFLLVFLGIALMGGTIVCNLIVVFRVSSARRMMRRNNSSHKLVSRQKRKRITQQENQMMILLGIMTTVFVVCYLPLLLRILVNQISSIQSDEFATSNLSNWDLFAVRMAALNPLVDPWVYILCRRSVISKSMRLIKLVFLCRCDKGEFQEFCLNSREFRRRKSVHNRSSISASSRSTKSIPKSSFRNTVEENNELNARPSLSPEDSLIDQTV